MKISELIEKLQKAKDSVGDIEVWYKTPDDEEIIDECLYYSMFALDEDKMTIDLRSIY